MREKEIFTNKYLVAGLAILACVLWGTAFPSLKISYQKLRIAKDDYFLKMLFASYRFFIASLILLSYQFFRKGSSSLKLKLSDLKLLIFLGLFQTTLQYFFFYNGLANTTGTKASILGTTGTFLTVIIAHFIYKDDKLNLQKSCGLIIGLLGVIIVNLERGSFDFSFSFLGEGFIISSAIVSTIASVIAKNATTKINPMLVTAYQMLMGSIILFLISIFKVSPTSLNFVGFTPLLLVYLSLVSAIGFALWYTLIKYNPLGYITMYKFVVPVSGVLFSSLLLAGEAVSINIFLALLLVSLGIIIINYKKTSIRKVARP
ncbi:DMT family transporter [Orenia marismortui]|uniref:Drug/metabolite transporter (DMT)-like permease n=1 Tax=Orenia marismortui TaxID=46469 RepID=A0A4R8GR86_9FIRM|nr:DMT family transporter [Orenia marismortui]TDX48366.1 drug/metabolite transporter (DMT)-like permease [Orenia marismortui]